MKLSGEGDVVVEIAGIASDIFENLDKGREIHRFLLSHPLSLHHYQIVDGRLEGVDLEELAFPDEALTLFLDGRAIRIGLLEHLLVKVVIDTTLGLDVLGLGDAFLGAVDVDHLSTSKHPTAQAHFTAWLCHEIGLCDFALGALGNLAHNLHTVDALFLNGLWQSDHLRNLL